jgi:hypothetical protein
MIRRSSGLSHAVSLKRDGDDGKGKKALTTMYDFKRERDQLFCFHQSHLSYMFLGSVKGTS